MAGLTGRGHTSEACLGLKRQVNLHTCQPWSPKFVERLSWGSIMYDHPEGPNSCLVLKAAFQVLGNCSHCREGGQSLQSKDRGGVRSLWNDPSSGVKWRSCPLHNLLQQTLWHLKEGLCDEWWNARHGIYLHLLVTLQGVHYFTAKKKKLQQINHLYLLKFKHFGRKGKLLSW